MTTRDTVPQFDLFGAKFKARAYDVYAAMRATAPVYRRVNRRGDGATVFVTRYDDAVQVLRDPMLYVKDVRQTMTPSEQAALPPHPYPLRLLSHHMLNTDPPDHTRLRALVNKAFTTRMVEQLSVRIEQIAHDLIDRIAHTESLHAIDLIHHFALPLPIMVIADLLGVPSRDHNRFRAWSNALVAPTADANRTSKKAAKARALMEDFIAYLREVFAARRRAPQDDLITSLLAAEEAGDVLSEEELFSMILLLIVVGHETTVNLIGNGLLALLQHPAALTALSTQPTLLPSAVEEMLRYDCPVERAPMRFAATDIELGDTRIHRGDAVSVVLGSANRDEAQFPHADRFEIKRTPNRHVAFGQGIHYCLGAPLARLEGRIAFDALLTRYPTPALAVPPTDLRWRTHPIMRGLQRLPVNLAGA